MADQKETVVLEFEVDEADAVESINSLTKANKELRAERNALNLQSEAGKKRAQEINALLDQNTNKIKTNVSALEKQKINIGNYKSALDGVHPALGKVGEGLEAGTSGFLSMAKAALAFIATPIGAILAGLVAVFTLLKSAISTNNEVFDKFENTTNAVGIVIDVLVNRVGKLGEALLALATGDISGALDKTKEAFSGIGDEIERAVGEGQVLLEMTRDLEDAQRQLRIETARQENVIKSLVVAAKNRNLTLEQQEDLLRKALALEQNLVATREKLAAQELEIAAREIANEKNIQKAANETFEEFANRLVKTSTLGDDVVDGLVEKIEKLEQARGSSLAFQEKVENSLAAIQEKRAVALQKQNEALAEQAALEAANRRAQNITEVTTDDPLVGAFQTQATLIEDINDKMKRDLAIRNEEFRKEELKQDIRLAQAQRHIEQQKLDAAVSVADGIKGLLDEQSQAYKAVASAQIIVSTYSSAQKAYEAAFLPIPTVASPALGVAFAAAAVLKGLANLAAVNNVQFADGGIVLRGPSHARGGIPIVAEGNEIIMTKGVYNNPDLRRQASALNVAGGGRSFADGGLVSSTLSQPIDQQLLASNLMRGLNLEVSAVEISKVQNRVKVKEQLSKR